MPTVEEITSQMNNLSKQDTKSIREAYEIAQKAHEGTERYSGEPYFKHVFATAFILAKLGMDTQTIIAGLLHDSIEDEGVDPKVIEEKFGKEILFLIEGVTKLGKIRFRGTQRHVESLRKLFVATSQDIRVLIIKLADRLHNMRTLEYVPEEKRERIAQETMEVYAPIAYRLQIGSIHRELEDLAFKYIDPDTYKKVVDMSKDAYKESLKTLKRVKKELEKELEKEKIRTILVDFRSKGIYSLYLKLKRKDMDIDHIYDISALRVIVKSVSDCYKVLGVIHSLWRPLPGRIKDYIAFPKTNGYQSIHTTVLAGKGSLAEIQIRTEDMHREAEFGVAAHARYKNRKKIDYPPLDWFNQFFVPRNDSKSDDEFKPPAWIHELADIQKDVEKEEEFLSNLRSDFFKERIFVFTPDGDVIDLPKEASPIDFAYHVHSDIGNNMEGAKINGKLVSLDTKLSNGDIVEIMTKKSASPNSKWLDYATTTAAKRHIRSTLAKEGIEIPKSKIKKKNKNKKKGRTRKKKKK